MYIRIFAKIFLVYAKECCKFAIKIRINEKKAQLALQK